MPPLRTCAGPDDTALDSCRIRRATDDDWPRLDCFYERLSDESRYLRFFSAAPHARRSAPPDDARSRFVLLAECGDDIVGTAEFVRRDDTEAEVAFAVLDAWQHHGLATRMLRMLTTAARERGIRAFTAQVLGTNVLMMQVFRESGLPMTEHLAGGVNDVVLRLDRAATVPS